MQPSIITTAAVLQWAHDREAAGMPTAEAQAEARGAIEHMRYGPGRDYFFLIGHDSRVLMHPTSPKLNGTDGSLIAEFRLSCTQEIKSWVLGFGARAVVLEPENLRREITEELRATLAAYETRETQPRPRTNRRAGGPSVSV